MGRLDGRVAIVTGAGTGLGRETALLYAQEGATVVVADVRATDGEATAEAIRAAGGTASFVKTDVSRGAEVEHAVATAEGEYGRLDIMTANAGIMGPWSPLAELSEEQFARVLAVNLWGVAASFKYAIPAIRRAGGGAMTATASLGAHRGFAELAAYCASKGGVVALVRALAAELAPTIRVNAVSPGGMATELRAHNLEDEGLGEAPPAAVENMARLQAAQARDRIVRGADPRDVARAHLFLVAPDGAPVNGQSLIVDNGWSALPA